MSIQKILVPTDFSTCADAALSQALWMARDRGADLCLLHVVSLHGEDPNHPDSHFPEADALFRSFEDRACEAMAKLVADTDEVGLTIHHAQIRAIAPAPAIVEYAKQEGFDLVVLGTHGRRGLRRYLMGSVAEEVVRTASCPVMTVRAGEVKGPRGYGRILVPFDFSDYSEVVLRKAVDLAKDHDGEIDLVHVVMPPPPAAAVSGIPVPGVTWAEVIPDLEKVLRRRAEAVASEGVVVHARVIEGPVEMTLVDYADENDVDVVMMASHGLTGIQRFLLGSVAEKVVRGAPCPVWVFHVSREEAQAVSAREGASEKVGVG